MDCQHNKLTRLSETSLHPRGRDYVCDECGEFLIAEVKPPIAVSKGTVEQSN